MSTFPVNGYQPTAIQPGYPAPIVVDVPPQSSLPSMPDLNLKNHFQDMTVFSGARLGVNAYGASVAIPKAMAARSGASIGTRGAFSSIGSAGMARAVGGSALVAIPMSLITNFIDWKRGKITKEQRNTLMMADAAGYTVAGAAGTMAGAAIGSALLPGIGTVLGIGVGLGLGYLYERFLRPRFPAQGQTLPPIQPV